MFVCGHEWSSAESRCLTVSLQVLVLQLSMTGIRGARVPFSQSLFNLPSDSSTLGRKLSKKILSTTYQAKNTRRITAGGPVNLK
ncbi:hypothetical protein DFH06DRAFT_1226126 [Mycena polygramma]|nr:hypothetical protein DFH06DRAFT_1226126 [Mycena polygramma]